LAEKALIGSMNDSGTYPPVPSSKNLLSTSNLDRPKDALIPLLSLTLADLSYFSTGS